MQANDGSSSGHIGVLSPRPDVIGPRDMARLTATRPARWAAARRVYESERDVAAEAEEVLKEYYENADPLVETGTTSQADYPLRYSAYMRGRSLDSANAQSDIPTTLSTTRSLTRPRTQPRTLGPNLSDYASQNVDRFVSTSIVDKELPFWSNSAPPQELDLPVFGDDLADNRDKSNLSEVTKGTEKPVSFVSTLRFRLDNEFSQHSSLSVPKKQRFENFVKFIQANKDLVDEYIKKKRGSYKASSRSNRAKGGPISLHRWGLDPVRQGITPPAVAGGPTSLPSVRGPEATLRKWMSQKSLVSTLPSPTTPVNHGNHQILRQDKGEQYSTTIDSRLLDLAPGRGRPIATMRLKVKEICFVFLILTLLLHG